MNTNGRKKVVICNTSTPVFSDRIKIKDKKYQHTYQCTMSS